VSVKAISILKGSTASAPQAGPGADVSLRHIVRRAIRESRRKKTPEQIAEDLSKCIGKDVTVHMLNAFTSESKKPARFPALFIEPLCEITGDDRLQRFVLSDRLRKLLRLGEAAAEVLGGHAQQRLLRIHGSRSRTREKRNGRCAA
jgi:hypothetical protein